MRTAAFTLFEVLIALAMFALALGGLAIALDKIVEASSFLRDEAEIRRQMESWTDQAMTIPLPTLAQGQESEPDAMGVTYSLGAEPAELRNRKDEELAGLWWVTVRATWTEGEEKQEWEEKFLRYEP
mgnify:CR=1 FL=1